MEKIKTVLVIYTNEKITSKTQIGRLAKYSFNTSSDVKEGDMIKSNEYSSAMQIVKVLDESFAYYNKSTGELTNEFKSSAQWDIRTLIIREEDEEVVYAHKLSS
jgi:hypothetical protein